MMYLFPNVMNFKPILLLLIITVMLCAIFYVLPRGVTVTVVNVGGSPLRGPTIYVTGGSYALGDIVPGQKRSVKVRPTGESHVEIGFMSPSGENKRINLGGYFEEEHYYGEMIARVDANWEKPVGVETKIWIVPW